MIRNDHSQYFRKYIVSDVFLNLFVFVCIILLFALPSMHYGTREANAERRDIRLVDYNDNINVNVESSNEFSASHAGDQTHFGKNDANPALGYSTINDVGNGIHVDLSSASSSSQQSSINGEHNHREDDKKGNGNGNNNKNSDTPFTLPFP